MPTRRTFCALPQALGTGAMRWCPAAAFLRAGVDGFFADDPASGRAAISRYVAAV
ncbi:hypothetical protein PY257_14175 [Ramlibacter sp. H39-3-26]|uniref:hypothetical protein n=1 Tax=Curvibacter soli TaxID=3031331 RepID=UPI0023D9955C|nr:hypothetical protein [Ramlibacter sp. H39-3-26]MDF1486309.1 hypothetical protein [Ramlibacter sp. H39-3-26]